MRNILYRMKVSDITQTFLSQFMFAISHFVTFRCCAHGAWNVQEGPRQPDTANAGL